LETAIGVFGSRERAEEAVKELLDKHVPKDSIVFLTRSENEATALATELGTYAGGFIGGAAGLSAGVAAATLFLILGSARYLRWVSVPLRCLGFLVLRPALRSAKRFPTTKKLLSRPLPRNVPKTRLFSSNR